MRRSRTQSAFPDHVELQLARLVQAAPAGDAWLHEVKFDGYRVLTWRNGTDVRITSRGAQDWTQKLPAAVRAAGRLACNSCILDGELVSLDARGNSSFTFLQRNLGANAAQLQVMVFDLLFLDGDDLRGLPQIERKRRLAHLLARSDGSLRLTAYTVGHGPAAAREACKRGLEGIVSKAAEAPYESGRAGAWLKCKCVQSDEYAIVGYTTGHGARARLGSLLLGTPARGAAWRYRGRVGTGLDEATIGVLLRTLKKSGAPPRFIEPPSRAQLRGAEPIWVRPEHVAEVEFRGETRDGLLRQPSLKGLRRDRRIGSLRPGARDVAQVAAPSRISRRMLRRTRM